MSRTLLCSIADKASPRSLLCIDYSIVCKKNSFVEQNLCHLLCFRFCRPLALGNTADAVEILSAGYILGAFKQEDGSPLNSTQRGKLRLAPPD